MPDNSFRLLVVIMENTNKILVTVMNSYLKVNYLTVEIDYDLVLT